MSESASARVLIVDGDAALLEWARARLAPEGYTLQLLASAEEALGACAVRLPDVALVGTLPDEAHLRLCSLLRGSSGGAHLPIVIMAETGACVVRAYEAGASDFIVKPIDGVLLAQRLRYVLRAAATLERLRVDAQRQGALLQSIPDGWYLLDSPDLTGQCLNPVRGTAEGAEPAPAQLLDLLPVHERALARESLQAALGGVATSFEFSRSAAPDRTRHFECRCLPHTHGQVLAIVRDVTERREADARIQRLAYFDALTGLPNREWIGEFLTRSLRQAATRDACVALLYVDLDQFKRINDTLGHDTGDALLRHVAERLRRALGEPVAADELFLASESLQQPPEPVRAELARVGGDEFIVVLTGDLSLQHAERTAERILDALARPFGQGGYELVVTPSVGIALFPHHGRDAQTLLKNADSAMYEAKSSGRNQYRIHSSGANARALKRLSLEMELRRALESAQLQVYYQPKYASHTLRITGAEALLRWFHPVRGQIPTADFVAVAEETGLIGEMGRWTLQQVCRDLIAWRAAGICPPQLAVNVSGHDLMRPDALLRLSEALEQAQLPSSLFELELTEGVLMRDAEAGRRALLQLKEFGFALAVDDFGTGYCSLNYLKRFPLDTLKVDRSFVDDINSDADAAAIVRAIIALGHNLNLRIVAEGVETREQLHFLRAEGCDAIQGFLMSAAVPAHTLAEMMRAEAVGGVQAADLGRARTLTN